MHLRCRALILCFLTAIPAACLAQSPPANEPDVLKSADAAFRAGFAARQAGNLDEARIQFAKAAALAPQIPEGHEALGEVLIELNRPAEAVAEFKLSLQLKPGDEGIESNLALAYAKAGSPQEALPQFAAAYQASLQAGGSPVDTDFCQAYARALAATGTPAEAIQMFQAAVDRGAATAEIFDSIGSLYAQSTNWAEAQTAFNRALSIDAAYIPARIHLGIVRRQLHDLNGSAATLESAAAGDPSSAMAQFELGRTLAAAGQDEPATAHLGQAVKLNPALPGAANELAMALQRQGLEQQAIPWFRTALQREPGNVNVLINLGLALTLSGNAKEGLDYFKQAQAAAPPDATLYKDQGVAHVQLSAFDEAIADFKAALALDPADPQLHYDLGMAYKFKDRVDDAIAELVRAGQMDPTLQDPPYTLGILYMQMGRLDDAITQLKKAVALRPENGDAWAILGSTLKQASRLPEARDALEKAIPLLADQPGPRVTLAGVLAEQAAAASTAADAAESAGDTAKAAQLRELMKTLRAQAAEYRRQGANLARGAVSRQQANFAMNAGNQLLLKGQLADAVSRYQQAIAADPTFADPHSQLAVVYDRLGRAADATAERGKAASLAAAK
jgi:tetratricopeptide (TPR) repeat protein